MFRLQDGYKTTIHYLRQVISVVVVVVVVVVVAVIVVEVEVVVVAYLNVSFILVK